jgi:hypothetical protein
MCILLITRKTSFERSYNYGIHAQRHFPPLSLERLQLLVDTGQELRPPIRQSLSTRVSGGFSYNLRAFHNIAFIGKKLDFFNCIILDFFFS